MESTELATLRAELAAARERLATAEDRANWLYRQLCATLVNMGGIAQPGVSDEFLGLGVPAEAAALLKAKQRAEADSRRLDKLDAMGDIGMIAIDNDLEGINILIVWNKFEIPNVPNNARAAIDAAGGQG